MMTLSQGDQICKKIATKSSASTAFYAHLRIEELVCYKYGMLPQQHSVSESTASNYTESVSLL